MSTRWGLLGAPTLLSAALLAGCSGASEGEAAEAIATTEVPPRPLVEAARACGLSDAGVLGDGGNSLTISSGGEENESDEDLEDIVCLLVQLEVPDHVTAHMDSTRALDGMQTNQWDNISARWTYHPDSGMKLTLVHQEG